MIAFGSLGATGWYSAQLRRSPTRIADQALLRYFRPGRNWAEWAIFAVPVLGGALVGIAGRAVADHGWPWIGLGIWVVATGVATGVVWPAERAIQAALATAEAPAGALSAAARRCERGAAVTSVCFVAALVVMVVQPF